jgi:hypothetical protein
MIGTAILGRAFYIPDGYFFVAPCCPEPIVELGAATTGRWLE